MTLPALSLIESIARTRADVETDAHRHEALIRLQKWQIGRLKATYSDLYALARYRETLDFFVQDLYGPHDFGRRDRDLKRIVQSWHRVLPERAIEAVTYALELESLSQDLDLALLDCLADAPLDPGTYADAYRKAGRRPDRQRQIRLILESGHALDELVRSSWLAPTLRLARPAARLAGLGALQEFLERGHHAFAAMGDAEELLRVIQLRETAIMRNLFAGTADPFCLLAPWRTP